MFRAKAKKGGARKRKGPVDSDEEAAEQQKGQAQSLAGGDGEQQRVDADADPTADEGDEAVLERMRSRVQSKGKAAGAMRFSSRAKVTAKGSGGAEAAVGALAGGLLSFDDDKRAEARGRKAKIRPNLVTASVVQDVEAQEDAGRSQYSSEMLAALRQEQNVLLPSRRAEEEVGPEPEAMDVETAGADVDMSVVDDALEEGGKQEEEEEEFIPLQAQMMQRRRRKNRVTFGVDTHAPTLEKTAEVVEDVASDEEEKEDSQRWEEELMRRGGLHPAPVQQKTREDKKRTYPTRKKMSCLSLDSLLMRLDRSLEAAEFENDRASRELARIEADVAIVEETLKSQREELLVSSEEFEYFQVIEDFVKGLSFCVREKLPAIEAKEKEVLLERTEAGTAMRDALRLRLEAAISQGIAVHAITQSDVWGFESLASELSAQDAGQASDFAEHFVEPYALSRSEHDTSSGVMEFFGDAIDDFSSLDRVYGRFQEWKSKFPDVYRDSYCDLAAEKLYAAYVRAEMVSWDPLSVAAPAPGQKTASWSLGDFTWFRVLSQHVAGPTPDGPLLYQVREFVVTRAQQAVDAYFDPCSGLQTQSLVSILEALERAGLVAALGPAVGELVSRILEAFSSAAKRFVLVTEDELMAATHRSVHLLANHELERFNALQDNLLNLFVALPAAQTSLQDAAFACLMRVLHLVLSFLSRCRDSHKTALVPLATQVVQQLAGSSFLRQTLTSSKREREWEHAMELFFPFLAGTATRSSSTND